MDHRCGAPWRPHSSAADSRSETRYRNRRELVRVWKKFEANLFESAHQLCMLFCSNLRLFRIFSNLIIFWETDQYTARQIRTIRTVNRVPNVPRGRVLEGSTLKPELRARPQPLTQPYGPQRPPCRRQPVVEESSRDLPLLPGGPSRMPAARQEKSNQAVRGGIREAFTASAQLLLLASTAISRRAQRGGAQKMSKKVGSVPIAMATFRRS